LELFTYRNQESESYRYQPGRIEDYEPGIRSSITQPQPVKQVTFYHRHSIKLIDNIMLNVKFQSPKISIPSKSFTNL
jgi:hypothetical protein